MLKASIIRLAGENETGKQTEHSKIRKMNNKYVT